MPLLYIDLIEGRGPSEFDAFGVPGRDRYQVVRSLGITRSPGLVVVHTVGRRRPHELELRFYTLPASGLAERCGLDPADLVVSVTENDDENWSFGWGRVQVLTGKLT